MANPQQRQKQKSGKAKLTRKTAQQRKKVPIKGSEIIAANWDKKFTLKQNYARLGLVATPNPLSGGSEKLNPPKKLDVEKEKSKLKANEAIIERDEAGNVVNIIYGKAPLEDMDIEPVEAKTEVVKQLEEQASKAVKATRVVSENEEKWLQALVDKHGDDYEAMFRDRKLNTMQNSAGQIKRKIKVWRENGKKQKMVAA
ncbi:hypothetical protein SAICODRAFT_26486 [Saitoella complicata NRRL Y-17804]|uniref:Nucleolar protein 16 n=1 Tax=Saitoella complicata (strain BCRC 22490 / CBS 7301 / JCM 7358 / NBRC 10748 / NRRL Y-17804) TaxID=698492 RepID=A0A0E9NL87_SAICN|nr:uncharacterized protein SAICODRAFT_26486 [Saitoella complicata NRRL Y-17804]ODQ51736.1 hypothetical protein SAICODRAFT_26486 [Saitoella complicata NRRL Y-17804]GAO50647.1 hypothetical protein G7K_4770-t1 [Saitoella complicata NRRL Y-17804]